MDRSAVPDRSSYVRRGVHLEWFTVAYNSLEGLIALAAGLLSGSIALVGFGFDSALEVTSGVALLWRLGGDADEPTRERNEVAALRIVGICFLLLAVYVSYDAIQALVSRQAPQRSLAGIVLAGASLIVMPLLARAKRRSRGSHCERGLDGRCETDATLHVPVRDSVGRFIVERRPRLVVG